MDRLLFLASSFICTKQTLAPFDSSEDCPLITYIIENGRLVEGEIIDKLRTNAFQDCILQCSKERRCTAVNFLLDVKDEPICLLVDRTAEPNESELPIPESIMYSAISFCLPHKVIWRCGTDAIWSFEKFPGRDLIDDSFVNIVDGISSLEQCLVSCLEREQCRAALYNKKSTQCSHSKISIQNVHSVRRFFKRNADVDLYENNCYPESSLNVAQCQFIRMYSSGFTDFFDERVTDVSDETKCEQTCLRWDHGNCRSFTYHREARMCYLSHTSPRTLNKNSLENYNPNLSSGDLEDCMQFKLKCKPDRMQIHGTSMKMFSGTLKARNDKKVSCEKKFLNVYEFHAEMFYNGCGTRKSHSPYLTFSNLVMLKEGSTELITIRDKLLQVNCRIHNDLEMIPDQYLSFQFQIEDENATKQMLTENLKLASKSRGYVTRPKYTLDVLDSNKNPAEVVQIGDKGYLLITLHEKPIKFTVIDVAARDINSGRTFPIIDSDGCAVPNGMLRKMHWIDNNHLQLTIMFGGFPDEADVIYQGYIKQCDDQCDLGHCGSPNVTQKQLSSGKHNNSRRKKRSMMKPSESRLFELSGDIYAVKSSNKLKVMQKTPETEAAQQMAMPYENNKSVFRTKEQEQEQVTASRIECITEDVKCLIVFLALCLQAIVLVVIIGITYIIIQHCTRQQRNPGTLELIQNTGNGKQQIVSKLSEK